MAAELVLSGQIQEFFDSEGNIVEDMEGVTSTLEVVHSKEVDSILNGDLFRWSYMIWRNYTEFGLPSGKGWGNERTIVTRVIGIWQEAKRIVQQEMEHSLLRERT